MYTFLGIYPGSESAVKKKKTFTAMCKIKIAKATFAA